MEGLTNVQPEEVVKSLAHAQDLASKLKRANQLLNDQGGLSDEDWQSVFDEHPELAERMEHAQQALGFVATQLQQLMAPCTTFEALPFPVETTFN
jgi:hypothetical protein